MLIFTVLAVGACSSMGLDQLSFFGSSSTGWEGYTSRGYLMLAEYEEFIDGDIVASEHFYAKSKNVRREEGSPPDEPDSELLSEALHRAMNTGRNMLQDALETLKLTENDRFLAEAQVNYDCWLEREVDEIENTETPSYKEGCRERFYNALSGLVLPEGHSFQVYFDSGRAVPDDESFSYIEQTAALFPDREFWRVRLTGHTDPAGDRDKNIVLSMLRAVAVRNSLAQYGVDPDKIIIEAAGEDGKRKEGHDDNDAGALRRVDIEIIPVYLSHRRKGPNIAQMMPHYFGSQGPDL